MFTQGYFYALDPINLTNLSTDNCETLHTLSRIYQSSNVYRNKMAVERVTAIEIDCSCAVLLLVGWESKLYYCYKINHTK